MKKIVIITGLTATGKSGLGVKLAKEFNGEIISADSVQIYKNLDIGSAKESKEIQKQIPHHLIDLKSFNEEYNVGEFLSLTTQILDNITKENKLPIIVGGTGMYIKALLEGYSLGDTTKHAYFREKYQTMAQEKGVNSVWEELKKINPNRAGNVHPNNIKRVIRYLEIETFGDSETEKVDILKDYQICAVGIVEDRTTLYEKINNRVDKMIVSGLENEVKNLISVGAKREHQSMNSIGYKEWFDYFENKMSKAETIDKIKQHTRNYAKRQLTFLKTINDLPLLNLKEAEEYIRKFLND